MPVDEVFCDRSGQRFNEFVPVDFVLGPYVRDLQANAEAHCSKADGKSTQLLRPPIILHAAVTLTILSPGLVSSGNKALGEERAGSGHSVTEPVVPPAGGRSFATQSTSLCVFRCSTATVCLTQGLLSFRDGRHGQLSSM